MKFIRFIFFTILALGLIAGAGIFILFQTFDPDQYVPKFTQKVSIALGRVVSVKHVGLGLSSRGITLDAWPLTIQDDPEFTSQPFIKVDRVRVSLNLRALVLQHRILVTHILFQSPQVHFIRSQDGDINVRSILQNSHENPVIQSVVKDLKAPLEPLATPQNDVNTPPNDMIRSVTIQDASISYIDQSLGMPMDVWLKHINGRLNGLTFSKPVQLSFNSPLLVFKAVAPGMADNPIFQDITGGLQLNMPDLKGSITVGNGVIRGLNIIKVVLAHAVGSFSGLDGIVNKLGADDTIIKKAETGFSYHDKTVSIDNFLIQTNILELMAQGSVDQGLNTDLHTMLHLNTDVSAALFNQLEGLKYLCDDSDRIAIGGSLKGVYPHLKYKSDKDFKKRSKKVFNAMFRQLLGA